jgi:diacylglycerol kinase family enzyme
MVLQTQSGAHEKSDLFSCTKVGAFAILPASQGTHLEVDGEVVAFEPLLLQVHPGVLRVVKAASA